MRTSSFEPSDARQRPLAIAGAQRAHIGRRLALAGSMGLAFVLATTWPAPASACDSDADCGGGTCIKREKRASGVCYGARRDDAVTPQATMPDGGDAETPPAAIDIPDYVDNRDAILESLTPSGITCMVSQQCPEGLECVVIEYQGTCMKIE